MNKLSPLELSRKAQICTRLVESVREYFSAFGKPIAMNILSAKYSRSLSQLGGFPEVLDELHSDGLIQVSMRETGGKEVWPAKARVRLPETSRMLIRGEK